MTSGAARDEPYPPLTFRFGVRVIGVGTFVESLTNSDADVLLASSPMGAGGASEVATGHAILRLKGVLSSGATPCQ